MRASTRCGCRPATSWAQPDQPLSTSACRSSVCLSVRPTIHPSSIHHPSSTHPSLPPSPTSSMACWGCAWPPTPPCRVTLGTPPSTGTVPTAPLPVCPRSDPRPSRAHRRRHLGLVPSHHHHPLEEPHAAAERALRGEAQSRGHPHLACETPRAAPLKRHKPCSCGRPPWAMGIFGVAQNSPLCSGAGEEWAPPATGRSHFGGQET